MQSKYLTAMDGMQRHAVQLGQRVQRAQAAAPAVCTAAAGPKVHACACVRKHRAVVHELGEVSEP